MNPCLRSIAQTNIEGLADFIEAMVAHTGAFNVEHLHKVVERNGDVLLLKARREEKQHEYSIAFGGEVPNSFSPLYEAAYFFQSLFLSAVGTLVLKNALLTRYQTYTATDALKRQIRRDILEFSESDLWDGLQQPVIPMVSSLDTDIEPYRYVKHQLWRIDDRAFCKRCSEVTKEDLGQGPLDESLRNLYWTEDDLAIAQRAMAASDDLKHAKALQYYLTLKHLLTLLGIDIQQVPLFFNFVPREELLTLGPDSDILKALHALHEPESIKIYARIVKRVQPWVFTFACPRCKESSKRVISARLKEKGTVIRMICSQNPKVFRNEYGTTVSRSGCGLTYEMRMPDTPHQLYELLRRNSFSVNFAARSLIEIIKTTFLSPVAMPVTQLGIAKTGDGRLHIPTMLPQGFGDHRELLTSMLATQDCFLTGRIAKQVSRDLQDRGLLTSRETLILGHTFPGKLHDSELLVPGVRDPLYLTDTSVFKALKSTTVEEIFTRSIDLNAFRLASLMALMGGAV
jgi:hypothetical protein